MQTEKQFVITNMQTGQGSVTVYHSNGAATASTLHGDLNIPPEIATGLAPGEQVRIADFGGDHKADYVVLEQDGSVTVYLNQSGGGKWTWGTDMRVPGRIDCLSPGLLRPPDFNTVRVADLNGDGRADSLCVNRTTGAVHAWTNNDGKQINSNGWNERGQIAVGVGL